MICNSKQNTIDTLISLGILNDAQEIVEAQLEAFNELNNQYTAFAKKTYNVNTESLLFSVVEGNKLVSNEILFKDIDDSMNSEGLYSPMDYFESPSILLKPKDVIPSYERYILYKNNLIRRLITRLASITKEKKEYSLDKDKIKELTKLENSITLRIEGSEVTGEVGLKEEVALLIKAPSISKFKFYAEQDFERLDKLSQSTNAEDLHEAKVTINFFNELGTFDIRRPHPLFAKEDVFNSEGEIILPSSTINEFSMYKARANEYNNAIKKVEEKALVDLVNNNSKIKALGLDKDLTYSDLTYNSEGLKDASWVDMYMMDITNGIFSQNGILPQVMMNLVQNSIEKNTVYAKTVVNRVDNLHNDLEKELRSLGYGLGGGMRGVSYDLFRATNSDGQFKDSITQRYTTSYQDERNSMLKAFDKALDKAREQENPVTKSNLFASAYTMRDNWYRKNTILIDSAKIPEIQQDETFKDYKEYFIEDSSHSDKLKSILGPIGYKEEIEKQKKLLKDYKVNLEVFTDSILVEQGVDSVNELIEVSKNKISVWEAKNNPFIKGDSYYKRKETKVGGLKINSSMSYNYSIPRKKGVTVSLTPEGFTTKENDNSTGYYDSRYATIEENEKLKEFHNLLMEVNQKMFDTMPPDVRARFNSYSIPALRKSLTEILFSKNTSLLQKISKAYRELIDYIKGQFGVKLEDTLSYANIDPITGLPDYKVNSSFLKSNKSTIEDRVFIESNRLRQAIGISLGIPFPSKTYDLNSISKEAISIIAENLGVESTVEAIRKRLPNESISAFPVVKVLTDSVTHQVVSENSFDLPKILKMYSHLTMEYAARQEVLPIVEMLKNHYTSIKKPVTTGVGESIVNAVQGETRLEGERVNSIRQINSWFERVVLGDYTSKSEIGDTRIKNAIDLKFTDKEESESMLAKFKTTIDGRIYTTDEKIIKSKIPSIKSELIDIATNGINETQKEGASKALTRLIKLEENLGKHFSIAATFDALFNFIRVKALAWNVSSYITNFAEGQVANMIVAATGDYFKAENIYRANDIVKGSFLKNMTAVTGKPIVTKGAKKARALMDRYRILQDASNELQKASTKTAFSSFKNFSPYEGMRRTEYLNQTPLMIAVLLDETVVGKDGATSNVWDAMNPNGEFTENFATEENKKNWEEANGQKYFDFSSKMRKLIVNAHGDYDNLRGNLATEYIAGKAMLMFKRWFARQVYQRFAMVPQVDLETGIKDYKGRYLSHSPASGLLHGAIVGFGGLALVGSGPVGLVIGATVGGAMGKFRGSNTGLNFLKELSIIGKEVFLNLLRIPVNNITGKATIKNIDLSSFETNQRDLRNLKANIVDMSFTLMWMGLMLFTKAMLWDDEDEDDDSSRVAHNLLANRFMQLSSQAGMYLNIVDTWENIGSMPILNFFTDVGKTAQEAQDFLEGKDVLMAGPNAGESALYNQAVKTFSPGIIRDVLKGDPLSLGFSTQAARQFRKSPFDSWFYGEEKSSANKVRSIRATMRKELEDKGLSKKEVRKKLNSMYRKRNRGESYKRLLKDYESK